MSHQNDEFLLVLRRQPRPAFTQALKRRLDAAPAKPARKRYFLRCVAAVTVLLSLLLLASPDVRAQIAQGIQRLIYGEVQLRIDNGDSFYTDPKILQHLSPAGAQLVYPHYVPDWVPTGYVLSTDVTAAYYAADFILIHYRWQSSIPGQSTLDLAVENNSKPQFLVGNEGEAREISVHGHVGALVVGSWEYPGHFGGNKLSIMWTEGGVSYFLSAENIPESDLLKMAESMR